MTKGVFVVERQTRMFGVAWVPIAAVVGRPAAEELLRAYDNRPSMWSYRITKYTPEAA